MLKISNSPEGQIQDDSRNVIVSRAEIKNSHIVTKHRHSRGQLLFTTGGSSTICIDDQSLSIAPHQAVWIQPKAMHEVSSTTGLHYCSAFVDVRASEKITVPSGLIALPSLCKALMKECSSFGADYKENSPESRLVQVLYDQFSSLRIDPNSLPLPSDTRLLSICERLLIEPWLDHSLTDWSRSCGASERTLARLFRSQTGLTFTQWRDKARVNYSIDRINKGDSVTTVSINLGYRSLSAFTCMFKRNTGLSPSKYFRTQL